MERCRLCIHIAVCSKYEATGGNVKECKHFMRNGKNITDLSRKCGGCAYSKQLSGVFGGSNCYVECQNDEHLLSLQSRRNCSSVAHIRARTTPACKKYIPREG